jgi:hypothetical protein
MACPSFRLGTTIGRLVSSHCLMVSSNAFQFNAAVIPKATTLNFEIFIFLSFEDT